jgi:hypothetical protein
MSPEARAVGAVIGFRVKSGWATAVLVTGSIQSPQVLDRRTIDLCDQTIPESRQPYHAGMGKLETDEDKVARLRQIVRRATNRSVSELIGDYRESAHQVRAAGLMVGSVIDPASVANPHIRAHALEGRLFRTVLEDALASCGLRCLVIVERNMYARAAQVLGRSEHDLKQLLADFGRTLGKPWRADEKAAALAAWLALA